MDFDLIRLHKSMWKQNGKCDCYTFNFDKSVFDNEK